MKTLHIGKGIKVRVDPSRLPPDVDEYLRMIGLRNVLADAHAQVTSAAVPDPEERRIKARAIAKRKLRSLYKGLARANARGMH